MSALRRLALSVLAAVALLAVAPTASAHPPAPPSSQPRPLPPGGYHTTYYRLGPDRPWVAYFNSPNVYHAYYYSYYLWSLGYDTYYR